MHLLQRHRVQYTGGFLLALVLLTLLRYHQAWFTDQLLLGSVAAAITIYLGLLRYQMDQDQVFKQLFKEFNERYDKMNEKLDTLSELPPKQAKVVVIDYLNLCAEEYLWYKKGRIDEKVWQAWLAGMREKLNDPTICRTTKAELNVAGDSYYGFLRFIAPELKGC